MLQQNIYLNSYVFMVIFLMTLVSFPISLSVLAVFPNHLMFTSTIAQAAEPSPTESEQEQTPDSEQQDLDPEQEQNEFEQDLDQDSHEEIESEAEGPAVTASPSAQQPELKQATSSTASTPETQIAPTPVNDNQKKFSHQLQQLFENIKNLSEELDQLQNRPQKLSADLPDETIIKESGFYIKHNSPSAIIAVMLGGACLLAASLLIRSH